MQVHIRTSYGGRYRTLPHLLRRYDAIRFNHLVEAAFTAWQLLEPTPVDLRLRITDMYETCRCSSSMSAVLCMHAKLWRAGDGQYPGQAEAEAPADGPG